MGKIMSLHDRVKRQVLLSCKKLGFGAKEEYSGKGWRADVFVIANDVKYAFEVQMSPQAFERTLERQEKYKRDGIIGCWLFEKERGPEVEDVPMFRLRTEEDKVFVSMKDRKELPLEVFIDDFIQNKIKFCQTLRLPETEIRFVKNKCWKCGFDYHVYYLGDFKSPCNTKMHKGELESLWTSEKMIFKPKIIAEVHNYVKTMKEKQLNISTIRERYSKTAQNSYRSFGCPKCDAIFGDWYLHELIIDTMYGDNGIVDRLRIEGDFGMDQNIPHWCHPGEHEFCE